MERFTIDLYNIFDSRCISKLSNRRTDKVSYILDVHQYGDVFFNSSHLSLITEEKFTITPLRFLTDRQTFQLEYKETYDNIHKLCEVNKNLIR